MGNRPAVGYGYGVCGHGDDGGDEDDEGEGSVVYGHGVGGCVVVDVVFMT